MFGKRGMAYDIEFTLQPVNMASQLHTFMNQKQTLTRL